MICFDVYINDKKICRAGLDDASVLSCTLSWAKPTGSDEELHLDVGGLRHPRPDVNAFSKWFNDLQIKPGDKISIEVVEAEEADSPAFEKVEMAADVQKHKLRYLEQLKKELGLESDTDSK